MGTGRGKGKGKGCLFYYRYMHAHPISNLDASKRNTGTGGDAWARMFVLGTLW